MTAVESLFTEGLFHTLSLPVIKKYPVDSCRDLVMSKILLLKIKALNIR